MHLGLRLNALKVQASIANYIAQGSTKRHMTDVIETTWERDRVLYAKVLRFTHWDNIIPIREAIHQELDQVDEKVGLVIDITAIPTVPKTMGLDRAVRDLRSIHPNLRMVVFVVGNIAIQTVLSGMVRMARMSNRFLFETDIKRAIALLEESPPQSPPDNT